MVLLFSIQTLTGDLNKKCSSNFIRPKDPIKIKVVIQEVWNRPKISASNTVPGDANVLGWEPGMTGNGKINRAAVPAKVHVCGVCGCGGG